MKRDPVIKAFADEKDEVVDGRRCVLGKQFELDGAFVGFHRHSVMTVCFYLHCRWGVPLFLFTHGVTVPPGATEGKASGFSRGRFQERGSGASGRFANGARKRTATATAAARIETAP
jgi:hypothetical protein